MIKYCSLIALLFLSGTILLTGCSSSRLIADGPPSQSVDVSNIHNAIPKPESLSRYGNPKTYEVNGHHYYVLPTAKGYNKKGIASWYGTKFHGHLTSTHEIYDMFGMTAASTELPLPTYVQVTNLKNGKQIIVKVNDRGPFDKSRILDLSYAGAKKLDFLGTGTALVQVNAIDPKIWQQQHAQANAPIQELAVPTINQPHIYLQVGAFKNFGSAQQIQNEVSSLVNKQVAIQTKTTDTTPMYRVQIGPLADVAENDSIQKTLFDHGFNRAMTVVR